MLASLRSFSEANQRLGSLVDDIGDRVDAIGDRIEELEDVVRANHVQEVYEVAGEAPEPKSSLESESESLICMDVLSACPVKHSKLL